MQIYSVYYPFFLAANLCYHTKEYFCLALRRLIDKLSHRRHKISHFALAVSHTLPLAII